VPGMLRWMTEQAEERGSTVRCGAMFLDAARQQDGVMRVTLGESTASRESDTLYTRFLIGADGTRSRVAQRLELDQNTRFLAGAEWLLEGVALDRETFYLVMGQQLAPGYCMWLAPHGDIVALGVAGQSRAFNPTASLRGTGTFQGGSGPQPDARRGAQSRHYPDGGPLA